MPEDDNDPFDRPNQGQVTLDPRFVCDECGFANVRLTTANGQPAAECTECGQGYLATDGDSR